MSPLESHLQHSFKNKELLQQALTHASVSTDQKSYERLEFLGDRILSFVVAEMLFKAFPEEEEGALAKRHSMVVKQSALERVAAAIAIKEHMYFAQQVPTPSMMADVVEALIAAIYLDSGINPARKFILSHWKELIESAELPPEDAKSALQEWAQARGLALPIYTIIDRSGPDHNPIFVVEVSVTGFPSHRATSNTKQSAQKLAARVMLDAVRSQS